MRPSDYLTRTALIVLLVCNVIIAAEPKEVIETLWEVAGDTVEWLVAAPDGSSVALAVRSGAMTIYKDKVKIGTYERVANPLFSSNSRVVAFLAIDTGKAFFVVDAKPLPPLNIRSDAVANPQLLSFSMAQATALSFDGSILAYRDLVGSATPRSETSRVFTAQDQAIFLNGKAEPAHPEVGPPVFNPVKNELVYRVRDNGIKQAFLVRPGVQSKKYVNILDPVVFNATGTRVGYIAQVELSKFVAVIDGVEQPETYEFASGLTFSRDGKRVAFVAGTPGSSNQYAVIDGKRGPAFNFVDPVTFSPDGARYGYVANTNIALGGPGVNESIVIVDGKELPRQKDARAFGPFLGPNGRTAFIIQSGARSYITIDGNREGPYAQVGFPVFSAAGKHVAYAAVDGISSKLKMVVDGTSSPPYTAVTAPRFEGENKVVYYAVKTGQTVSVMRIVRTF